MLININTSIGIAILNIQSETAATSSFGLVCMQSEAIFSLRHLSSPLGGALGTRAVGLFGPVRWQQSRLAVHQINTACHTWFICMWGEAGCPPRSWLICHLQSTPGVSPGNFPAVAVPHFQTVLFDGSDDVQSDAERRGPVPGEICGCAAHTCYLLLLSHFLFPAQTNDTLPGERHMRSGPRQHVWCDVQSLRLPLQTEQLGSCPLVWSQTSKVNSAALRRWCEGHPDQSQLL